MQFDTQELRHVAAAGRFDMYTDIHKALRAWMGDVQARLGAIDVEDEADCASVLQAFSELLDMMHSHLQHENNFVHAAIEARQPGASAALAGDHVSHIETIAQLQRQGLALQSCPAHERAVAALCLYREFVLFAAENMAHMQVEETESNGLLQALYTDEELLALHERLVGSIPPAEMMAVTRWMLPAITPQSRAQMLAGIRATAPAEAFEATLAAARTHLRPADWDKLQRALDLPPPAEHMSFG